MERRCIVLAANRGYALSNSRQSLIRRMLDEGWEVVLATRDDDESKFLCESGAQLEPVSFQRGGFSVFSDIPALIRLAAIYRRRRPVLVQHFHAKPVILGSLAARRAAGKRIKIVNTITGLGQAFAGGRISSSLSGLGYRLASQIADGTVFQNRDDRKLFLERHWTTEAGSRLIVSSGVDLARFSPADRRREESATVTILLMARLIWQKGIREFVDVASQILARGQNVSFLLAGEEDGSHPNAVDMAWLRSQRVIEYLGKVQDVESLLARTDIFLFPSSYREGVPRAVLEASAMGVPTVAFDVPGVREIVIDGETGFLAHREDVGGMVDRVFDLVKHKSLRRRMGEAARKLVESRFDMREIESEYLALYHKLVADSD